MGLHKEQINRELEQEGKRIAKTFRDFDNAKAQGRLGDTAGGKVLIELGLELFATKIQEYLDTPTRGTTNKDKNMLLLMMGSTKETAYLVLRATISSLSRGGEQKLTDICSNVVKDIRRAHLFVRLKKDNPKLHTYLGSEFRRASSKRKDKLIERHLKSLVWYTESQLHTAEAIRIGATLLNLLIMSGANIINKYREPWTYKNKSKMAYAIRFTEEAEHLILNSVYARDMIAGARLSPMIVEPIDWTAHNKGGYLQHKISFVKFMDRETRLFVKEQDYSEPMRVVNKLQKVAWRVNSRVTDIIHDMFTNSITDPTSPTIAPTSYGKLPIAVPPSYDEMIGEMPVWEDDHEEWRIWNKRREKIQIERDASQSRRMSFYHSLGVAQDMMNYDRFYFVYQLDYRGRVYPHSDSFNPQTQSYIKAMLEFADGEYLTDDGYYWLKVHTANTYGLDKLPFEERVQWFDDNYSKIVTIATNPEDSLKEWAYADSPYEFLAACLGVLDYGNGEKVHLPIQLDATCSGIQFYSGLLLDKQGAESVNVIGNTRNDIYQMVADKVNRKLENGEYDRHVEFRDRAGNEQVLPAVTEAKSIAGKITRKMTKSNTMTVPYSVSLRGMQDQNWAMMDEAKLYDKVFWVGEDYIVNKLITSLNHKSIYELVEGARLGQEYLKQLTDLIKGEAAEWTTPMYHYPIKQAAYKKEGTTVQTPLGTLTINVTGSIPDNRKQKLAIAPNYIHSLDSDLLLYCIDGSSKEIGVIHDCFLVNPNQGGEIRNLYRQGYVKLMKSKPLELISKQIDTEGLIDVPCIGTLDLDEVYDAEYIIS